MKKIGLLINPIAGIGGKVGLKGSDGSNVVREACAKGAIPESESKASITLSLLKNANVEYELLSCPGHMGEAVCLKTGIDFQRITAKPDASRDGKKQSESLKPSEGESFPSSTRDDTLFWAKELVRQGIDLLLFAGGDGTARDILDAVGEACPVLGIPTGCKIHSAVFALNPKMAGELLIDFLSGKKLSYKEAEVMDLDENLFRQGIVQASLYGYLRVPHVERFMQNKKASAGSTDEEALRGLSVEFKEEMEMDRLYIIGTGSTTSALMKNLNIESTLLGVDLLLGGKRIAADCSEKEILQVLDKVPKAEIVVSIIGGQGYVFGRGNQQISAEVIRRVGRKNILIISTENKLLSLPQKMLYADTGNEEVNQILKGYVQLRIGYKRVVMMKLLA